MQLGGTQVTWHEFAFFMTVVFGQDIPQDVARDDLDDANVANSGVLQEYIHSFRKHMASVGAETSAYGYKRLNELCKPPLFATFALSSSSLATAWGLSCPTTTFMNEADSCQVTGVSPSCIAFLLGNQTAWTVPFKWYKATHAHSALSDVGIKSWRIISAIDSHCSTEYTSFPSLE